MVRFASYSVGVALLGQLYVSQSQDQVSTRSLLSTRPSVSDVLYFYMLRPKDSAMRTLVPMMSTMPMSMMPMPMLMMHMRYRVPVCIELLLLLFFRIYLSATF